MGELQLVEICLAQVGVGGMRGDMFSVGLRGSGLYDSSEFTLVTTPKDARLDADILHVATTTQHMSM